MMDISYSRCLQRSDETEEESMMQGMMSAMSWATGTIWLLVVIVLVLGAADLLKYLIFSK